MHRARIGRWAALCAVGAASLGGAFACTGDDASPGSPVDGGATDATVDGPVTDAGSDGSQADQSSPPLDCEIAIVGGGPGGVHTAFRLTHPPDAGAVPGLSTPSGVCLFEKNDRLGGRIRDVQFGPDAGDVTGTGAYRMYDIQYTHELAQELGVATPESLPYSNLRALQDPGGHPGQYFGYSGAAFEGLYGVTSNDDQMWQQLLCGAQVPKDDAGVPDYTRVADGGIATMSTVDYARAVLGDAGAQYFFDQNRFRADFVPEVDAIGYLQYAMIDYYAPETILYPVPGHSAILGKMQAAIEAAGGRIFLSEPVSAVSSQPDGTFTLQTSARSVHAKQVVLAIPPGSLGKLTGDVITTITSAKELKSVTSAKSMQVTHRWNKKWWNGDLRYPDAAAVVGGDLAQDAAPILRADTTIKPDGTCINSIEMPYTRQRDDLVVTRTVYSDDRACVDKNLQVYGDGGAAGADALNAELLKSLRILFPAVFDGSANEPQIEKTDVNVHEEAWFYLKTGAEANGVTLKSLFDWSVNPVPGKNVFLVGDAWYPLGSGWSNAAYISSIRVLDAHFGMSVPSHELTPIACPP